MEEDPVELGEYCGDRGEELSGLDANAGFGGVKSRRNPAKSGSYGELALNIIVEKNGRRHTRTKS